MGVSEAHHAGWIPGDGDLYVEPIRLDERAVPADLLARLQQHSPRVSPHGDPFEVPEFRKPAEVQ